MQVAVVTLFPEMFAALTEHGVSGRGIERGLLELSFWNPRTTAQTSIVTWTINRLVVVPEC